MRALPFSRLHCSLSSGLTRYGVMLDRRPSALSAGELLGLPECSALPKRGSCEFGCLADSH